MTLEWYDLWRLMLMLVSTYCLYLLAKQFVANRHRMNELQRDRWFMHVMWILAAWEMQLEGILRNSELRWRLVFVTAAVILTCKLLSKKETWHEDP